MRNGKAIRLPTLILILGCAGAILTSVVPAKALIFGLFSIAGTIFLATGFLFTQLDVFEKAADSPDLTSTEIRNVNIVSAQRRRQIKVLLALGLLATGIVAAPYLLAEAEVSVVLFPWHGLVLGCVLAFASNCIFVYFDWREDLVQMQQKAKQRAALRAEADKSLARLASAKPLDIGNLDGFHSKST